MVRWEMVDEEVQIRGKVFGERPARYNRWIVYERFDWMGNVERSCSEVIGVNQRDQSQRQRRWQKLFDWNVDGENDR